MKILRVVRSECIAGLLLLVVGLGALGGAWAQTATPTGRCDGATDCTYTNGDALTEDRHGLWYQGRSSGSVSVTNSGAIAAGTGTGFIENGQGDGGDGRGIWVQGNSGFTGSLTLTNTGAITVGTRGERQGRAGILASHRGASGGVTVTSSGDITTHGVFEASPIRADIWHADNTDTLRVDVTGGTLSTRATGVAAVHASHNGDGDIDINVGVGDDGNVLSDANIVIRSPNNAGVYAFFNANNDQGEIDIDFAGRIEAATGIRAWVRSARNAATPDDAPPLINIRSRGTIVAREPPRPAPEALADGTLEGALWIQAARLGRELADVENANGIEAWALDPRFVALDRAGQDSGDTLADEQFEALLTDEALRRIRDAAARSYRSLAEEMVEINGQMIVLNLDNDEHLKAWLRANKALAQQYLFSEVELNILRTDLGERVSTGSEDRNTGNIVVTVGDGSVSADGDGVRALYARPDDRNGAIAVTVASGASVTGGRSGIYLSGAGRGADGLIKHTVMVDGAVTGGTVNVGASGRVIAGRGDAILSSHGKLVVTVDGRVRGNIVGMGEMLGHAVTVNEGGEVIGNIRLAGSTVNIHGRLRGNVILPNGGMVVIGPTGRILRSGRVRGDFETPPMVTLVRGAAESAEDALMRISGGRGLTGVDEVRVVPNGCDLAATECAGQQLLEVIHSTPERIYEALPSVLLGLNGLASYDDRTSAAQSGRGGWIGIEGTAGTWSADESTTGVEYDLDRWAIRAGVERAVGESAAVGIAVHHVRGDADVDESDLYDGGAVDATGTGLTLSARWVSEDDAYVIGQLARTWYDVDLSSSTDGELRDGVDATGLALGIEFGRRWERGDWLWTPRASVVRSSVSVDDFTDLGDTRVSVEDGMSVTASMGVRVESESGLFGSVDVEHELSGDREVTVSGTRLESEAESTRLRLNVGGARGWGEGRYEMNGRIGYAAAGGSYEFNGNLTLEVRF